MNTKAHKREMKARRKKLIVAESLPALANVPPQQCHILVHMMRRRSSFFAIVIVLTHLRNSAEDFDVCVAHVNIFY